MNKGKGLSMNNTYSWIIDGFFSLKILFLIFLSFNTSISFSQYFHIFFPNNAIVALYHIRTKEKMREKEKGTLGMDPA